ncbi:phenylalanine--tRNA ligase subunit beta [Ruminococcaceae bacterium OttesenSCG-928-N02]|nr:phenylalanine--tRNA ligase subunit beta [Ruminococcaceae bacterium OttesenSCG-928-N02]
MNAPIKWLQSYAPFNCDIHEFADRMTMTGSKVEGFECEADHIKNVVVGKVEKIAPHPDADHLVVCTVNVGAPEMLTICTGADNLKENDLVPVALHGARLPGGVEIRRTKMRGVPSEGMLCSLEELALTTHDFPGAAENGILVLEQDAPLGQDATIALGMNDTSVEFEITPNRPDCHSIIGLAQEAAATFGVPFNWVPPVQPAASEKTAGKTVDDYLQVGISATQTCQRYAAAVVTNVRVKPSPRWMRERLRLCGVRPINNIVDITNYVMLEYGQPMHAFDHAYVKGGKIEVRMARAGESITTLDGVVRPLNEQTMVIADGEAPIAIAGVMGGEYSGVYENTTTIVFESACFDGPTVRTASRRVGLRTDASSRYEKGLNPENCGYGLHRALELVQLLDAGDIVGGIADIYPTPRVERKILFEPARINKLLGTDIPAQEMLAYLAPLGLLADGEYITVPKHRYDITGNHDLLEEVARMYGYNRIPSTIMKGTATARPTKAQVFHREVEQTMLAQGFYGCETYSFYSPKVFDLIRLPQNSPLRNTVVISNPLGEDTSLMRTTALPSLLAVTAHNHNARQEHASLYEIATIYLPAEDEGALPDERPILTAAQYGPGCDYRTLKGIAEAVLKTAGIADATFVRAENEPSYHPGRTAHIMLGDEKLGTIGEIHPQVLTNYDIRTRVCALELDMKLLYAHMGPTVQFTPLPRHPAVVRDLALICDADTASADIIATIKKAAGKALEKVELFDIYTGKGVEDGKKSLAYSLTLRWAEQTLTLEEADTICAKVLKKLGAMNVTLRA